MSATSASAPPQDSAGAGRPRMLGSGLLFTLVAALVLLGLASWLGDSMIPAGYERVAQILALAAPAAAVILLVGGVLLPKLAARRQRSLATEAVTWIENLDVNTGEPDLATVAVHEDEDVDATEDVEDLEDADDPGEHGAEPLDFPTRVLQLRVRSLESTLEEQHRRLEDVRRSAHRQFAAAARRDRERVLLTVQALRDVVGDQSGLAASNRLEAALGRIGADTSFERPLLVAGSPRGPVVSLGSPQPVAPNQSAPAQVSAPQSAPAQTAPNKPAAPGPTPVESTVDKAPAETPPVEPVVKQPARVLPVPAPTRPAAQETRSRRRSRRPADA